MSASPDYADRVRTNQARRSADLKPVYDFIVCGSGSSGSVVARRLAEDPHCSVLLLEAGASDDVPAVMEAARWPENLGSERDWAFQTRPNPHLKGRSLLCSMGKVLGGSSSINLMIWARGHQSDWDGFAEAAGDSAWNYESILGICRRIEDWQGAPDPHRRGSGGIVHVQQVTKPSAMASAFLEAAETVGIPTFSDHNGAMMESAGGAALSNYRSRDGRRLSVFRSYLYPVMDRPNLTVLTGALVTRVLIAGRRATGVEVSICGAVRRFLAGQETILCLGSVQTPKVLMQSGIGDGAHLRSFGIPVVQDLPGVGRNLQEHVLIGGCVFEYAEADQFRGSGPEATLFARSEASLSAPDLQAFIIDGPFLSPELASCTPAGPAWSITPGVVRPQSRGTIRLTGSSPADPLDIDNGVFSDPADVRAAVACVRLCRAIGNAQAFNVLRKREVLPGDGSDAELEEFVRNAAVPFWHYTSTAKMGSGPMSVVNGKLQVHNVEGLRVADASIMPNVTTGNTMAPCVIIGERAAEVILHSQR